MLIVSIAGLILVSVSLLAYGGFMLWQWYSATNNPSPTISTQSVTVSTTTPDETPPIDACKNYTVAPTLPRHITIESIGVSACIEHVGVDQNNQVAVPTNIHLAGWYTQGPIPGQQGVSLIDGHVLGRYGDAVFADLANVKANDIVKIEFGDKTVKEFEIFSSQTFSLEDSQDEFLKQVPGVDSQLTLITCGGDFDSSSQTYSDRVVVRAKLRP